MIDQEQIQKMLENHERRIAALEGTTTSIKKTKVSSEWYKPGSTVEKIILLIKSDFFKKPRTLSDIVSELKTRDYHLKTSDLTLPMRNIVRKNLLKKTDKSPDGTKSKNWLYIEG